MSASPAGEADRALLGGLAVRDLSSSDLGRCVLCQHEAQRRSSGDGADVLLQAIWDDERVQGFYKDPSKTGHNPLGLYDYG